jgi:cytochrome c peroxidase
VETSSWKLLAGFVAAVVVIATVAVVVNSPGSRPPLTLNGAFEAQASPKPALPLGVSPELYALATRGRAPSEELVALGEKLFKDKRLSVDDSISCATCHDPAQGFTDHRPGATSAGVGEQRGQRNAPTVLNAMFQESQFWDGRAAKLEDQAKLPILNPIEMGQSSPDVVVAKVGKLGDYTAAFKSAFGGPVTYDDLAAAIAAFERTQYSGNAPFDRFLAGETQAISDPAKRGWALFQGKGRCSSCHAFNSVSPLFSDQKFHNIGIAAHKQSFPELARKALAVLKGGDLKQIDELALQTEYSELGRFLVTKNPADIGAFKSQTLRNIGITGPYMHDGSLATLWDVMDHYNKGGVANPFLDGGMERLGLSESEIDDMVAWLFSLTDARFAEFSAAELARQAALKTNRPQRETEIAEGRKGHFGDLAPNPDLRNPATIGAF